MLKSVWLTNLITASMNDCGSVLSNYFRCLSEPIRADRCTVCLYEPDRCEIIYLPFTDSACVVPSLPCDVDNDVINKAMKDRTCITRENILYAPLYFENTDSFGIIIFENPKGICDNEALTNPLIAFSTILYSESMGSIIKSSHDTVMRTEKLCMDFTNGKIVNHVLKNVDLEIYEKEFTVITGASGSGKSTLLNVLGGMLTASSGKVWWRDKEITSMTEKEQTAYRGNTVGFVFQRYNLISDLTVEENIKIAASLVKNPLPVAKVLDMVGITDKAKSYPSQLSGGQQQRVCIARALVKRADILLCDEPTGALDTENAVHIITILKRIAKEQGIPVIVITHNPSLVVLADHFIKISNGIIVDDRLQPFALSAEELKLQ